VTVLLLLWYFYAVRDVTSHVAVVLSSEYF